MGYEQAPERLLSLPDFSTTFFALDMKGALQLTMLPSIVAILFTDLFDSLSTFIGVATASGLTDEEGASDQPEEGVDCRCCGHRNRRSGRFVTGHGLRRKHCRH